MRDIIFSKTALLSILIGLVSGGAASYCATVPAAEHYGLWLRSFYEAPLKELWINAAFSSLFFIAAVFVAGLFLFGYLLILPVNFYFGYTFGFLAAEALGGFGNSALPNILFKLPSLMATGYFLCKISAEAIAFSIDIFAENKALTLRKRTANYIGTGLFFILCSTLPLLYDTLLIPKIFNLWVSF